MHFRGKVENRFASSLKIHTEENRPNDLTLDYLRGRHYQAIRAAVRLTDDALVALPTRHRIQNSSVGGRDEMVRLPSERLLSISFPSSCSSPPPLRLVPSRATTALSTLQRQFTIHLSEARAHLPAKSFPNKGDEFFRWRRRHIYIYDVHLSFTFCSCKWHIFLLIYRNIMYCKKDNRVMSH